MNKPTDEVRKEDRMIMCVRADVLFPGGSNYFQGFSPHNPENTSVPNFYQIAMDNAQWRRRGDVEDNLDMDWKQVIPYVALVNPINGAWAYQRSEDHDEPRLAGQWSVGLGGHVEESDGGGSAMSSFLEGRTRELTQEVELVDGRIAGYEVLGYLNYDSSMEYNFDEKHVSVGLDHFGILTVAKTNATQIRPKDDEVARGLFKSGMELQAMCIGNQTKVEPWTRLAMPVLKRVVEDSIPF